MSSKELPQTGEAHQQSLPAQSEVVDHRVENMVNEKPPTVKDEEAEVVEVDDSERDSDSSDSASDFCISSDEGEKEDVSVEPPTKVTRAGRVEQANACFKKHKASRVVHYIDREEGSTSDGASVFACGRRVGANHIPAGSFELVFVCKLCKMRANRDGALSL